MKKVFNSIVDYFKSVYSYELFSVNNNSELADFSIDFVAFDTPSSRRALLGCSINEDEKVLHIFFTQWSVFIAKVKENSSSSAEPTAEQS